MLENQMSLPVLIGEKVLWLGSGSGKPKSGKVLWIGRLPEISEDWALGLELDESLPFGGIDGKWSGRQLFNCKPKHGLLVPASSILTAKEVTLPVKDADKIASDDGLFESETSKEVAKYLGQDSFCGSLYSQVKPKPAVRKKHQQPCTNVKSDTNNNTHNEAVLKSPAVSSSLMSHSSFPELPVIPPRNKDVVKFCKLFGYSEPTNIIIDDRHFQLYNDVAKGNAVLNFSTQIEGNQNGVRIRKTMSAYYGNGEQNDDFHNETKKISSLKTVKRKLFPKSSSAHNSNLSVASSACSDSSTKEKRLSGLFSFFRWFNKDKRKNTLTYSDDDQFPSEPASPSCRRAPEAFTGSVDSVYSTATCNSFFYVPPSRYKSKHSALRRIPLDAETDTYRNRIQQIERSKERDKNISLRKKYKLLGSALTLHSSVDNISLCDRSYRLGSQRGLSSPNSTFNRRKRPAPPPPVIREVSPNPNIEPSVSEFSHKQWKNHRRSSSESAKDKKAGAYFHVKGKRKAPPPPSVFANKNQTLPRNLTIGSLSRKKRLAPQPPKRNSAIFPSTSYRSDDISELASVVDDIFGLTKVEEPKQEGVSEIEPSSSKLKIIEVGESNLETKEKTDVCAGGEANNSSEAPVIKPPEVFLSKAEKQKLFEDFEKLQAHNKKHFNESEKSDMAQSVCNDSLKLEKGFLKPNKSNSGAENKAANDKVVPPPSPVAPRPWYKRTVQNTNISHGASKLPLLEKLKSLERNKEEVRGSDFPEVSSTRKIRTSASDSSVLSFLSPSTNLAPSIENKRRSQLTILTNISELDREAAEIVRNERMRNLRLVSVENEKFYDSKLELPTYDQNEGNTNSSGSSSQKKTSARDLISLFNAISNVTKVTVNTAFFTKDSLNLFSKDASSSKSSKKNSDKKKSSVTNPSHVSPALEQEEEDDSTFVNLHALDDIEPNLNGSKNLCEEVMTEFDLRKSRPQELFEINRMKRHHSPSSSIPTITEMSESVSSSTITSPVTPTATVDFPTVNAPPVPAAPLMEEVSETKSEVATSSYNAVWSCPRCTLENPMWRILCDACHLFRTTIAVKPIEPPVIKPVDLSLPSITAVPSASAASSDSTLVVDSKKSPENVICKKQVVSDLSRPLPTASREKESTSIFAELIKPAKSTKPNDDQSTSVEAPPFNFEEAKNKFSNLESKSSDKKISSSSGSNKLLDGKSGKGAIKPSEEVRSTRDAHRDFGGNRKVSVLKDNSNAVEKLRNIPPSALTVSDDTINTNTREEKLIRDKIVPSNKELVEVRKARLAFFDKKGTENNLNKKLDNSSESSQSTNDRKEMDHSEREKLKLMLREMKHSLAKQESVEEKASVANKITPYTSPPDERKLGAIKKQKNPEPDSKKLSYKKVTDYLDGMEKEKTAEAYLVTSDAIFEDVKIKSNKPLTSNSDKVSTSVQTSSVVRKTDLPPNIFSKPPARNVPSRNIIAPVIIEEYNIKNGIVYSSVKRDHKPISIGSFELIRTQDFAGLNGSPQNHTVSHIYANIPSDASVSESYSQISDPSLSKSSNLSVNKSGSFHYSASLSNTTSSNVTHTPENVTTLAINRLLRRLETAIAKGQHHQAASLAKELARLKISCSVMRQKPVDSNATNSIIVNLFVEDKVSHQGPFPLMVDPGMKVADLKLKVDAELEVPVRFQRWILGKQLVTDDSCTLRQLGVDSPGCPFFLYLVAPESPKQESAKPNILDQKHMNVQQEPLPVASAPTLTFSSSDAEDRSLHDNTTSGISNILEEVVEEDISEDLDNADASLIENDEQLPELITPTSDEKESNVVVGWRCSACTLMNSPTCTSCAVCTNLRPADYQVPENYVEEKQENEAVTVGGNQEAGTSAEVKLSNYHELLNLDKSDLIPNMEEFDCPVCLSVCKPQDGVVLRECLHTFCKVCLANMVEFCEEPEVKCPFQDSSYSCDSTLQEREIKALVTTEQYEMHLAKSIAQAETKIVNTFHCKTPDCRGWCIFEDNVNYFLCPVCNRNNCLTCQAIHSGINCKQYQEQMKEDSETNVDAKRTRDMLEEMVERGEAMACPTCQVVLMKKWGCDWVRCSMCKTEICWVRRCARWGPKGRGDTTGGCQCGVNGVKCHPKCTYCH